MTDFDTHNQDSMTVNGLHCVFNMPKAVKQRFDGEKEIAQSLPPYAPRKAFKVDEYNCPDNWQHGSDLAASYFVPVEADRGLWLDFNKNSAHTHHVAILISIQGINPLDGLSMVDGNLSLKQYKTKCPVHDINFKDERYCEKCGYKWVPQNYLSTTSTTGLLWLDGFLAADGVVRQYYFTEDEIKGIAHQIIGEEKKVYSIGIAFYLSKEPKPQYSPLRYPTIGEIYPKKTIWYDATDGYWTNTSEPKKYGMYYDPHKTLLRCRNMKGAGGQSASINSGDPFVGYLASNSVSPECISADNSREVDYEEDSGSIEFCRSLDIAAGAKIEQKVYMDNNDLSFWQEKPAGLIYINYCPIKQAKAILKKGKKDLTKGGEGFLAGLRVGNR